MADTLADAVERLCDLLARRREIEGGLSALVADRQFDVEANDQAIEHAKARINALAVKVSSCDLQRQLDAAKTAMREAGRLIGFMTNAKIAEAAAMLREAAPREEQ